MTLRVSASETFSLGPVLASTERGEAVVSASPASIRRIFGDLHAREYLSLLQENDPTLRAEGFLALASQLERQTRPDLALQLYGAVLELPAGAALHRLAQERLQILQGHGPLIPRIESLGRRFVAQATDYRMIAAFGFGAWVAGLSRLSAGAWLANCEAGFLTRGFAARWASGAIAYAAEVPAFVGARRLFSGASLQAQEQIGLSDELASAALFLGVLRITGSVGAAIGRRWRPETWQRMAWSGTVGLGGVYLAHRLEESVGLRPSRDEATRWIDSADTWLQMQVGARLMQGLGGLSESHARFEILNRHALATSIATSSTIDSAGEFLEAASLPTAYLNREIVPPSRSLAAEPQMQRLARAWVLLDPSSLTDILTQVHRIGAQIGNIPGFVDVLERMRPTDSRRLTISLRRLRHMVEHSRPIGARGNYLEWLARWGVTEAVRQDKLEPIEQMLQVLYDGSDLASFERLLEPLFPQYRMRPMTISAMRRALKNFVPLHHRIRFLPLGTPARDLLNQAHEHIKALDRQDPLHMDLSHFVELLQRNAQEKNSVLPEIERAMASVPQSPLSYMRLFRIYRILAREYNVYPKYRELAGEGLRLVGFERRLRNPTAAEEVDGSQANGFYDEPEMAQMLADFYRSMWKYVDGASSFKSMRRREEIFQRILPEPGPLTVKNAYDIFRALGDPISVELADSLSRGQVELEISESSAFEAEVDRWISGNRSRYINGVFVPGEKTGGRDLILIRQIEDFSPQGFYREAFHRLGYIVHEHEHFRHQVPGTHRGFLEITRQEMRSCHREFQWLGEHGEPAWVHSPSTEAASGWAMHLRSLVEQWNFRYSDPND